jgi:hypothetical protein
MCRLEWQKFGLRPTTPFWRGGPSQKRKRCTSPALIAVTLLLKWGRRLLIPFFSQLFWLHAQRPLVAYFWTFTLLFTTRPPEGKMTIESVRYTISQISTPHKVTLERKWIYPEYTAVWWYDLPPRKYTNSWADNLGSFESANNRVT